MANSNQNFWQNNELLLHEVNKKSEGDNFRKLKDQTQGLKACKKIGI